MSDEKPAECLHTIPVYTGTCAALDCARHMGDVLEQRGWGQRGWGQPNPLDAETRAPLIVWLKLLAKAITNSVKIVRDEQGQIVQASKLPDKEKGSYRLGSTTDPDATYRVHGKKKTLGYNVSVAVNDEFAREIRYSRYRRWIIRGHWVVNGVEIQEKMRYPCCFLKPKSKAAGDRNDNQANLHPDLHHSMCGLGDMEMARSAW